MAVHIFSLLMPNTIGGAAIFCLAIPVLYAVSRAIYNIIFHPLRSFPGPINYAASRIPYCRMLVQGTLPFELLSLHEKYGEVVRIAPDELSFSHPDAWKDIMGHLKSGQEMSKYQKFYRPVGSEPTHIVDADREEHSRLRRQLAHGFSDKSMRDQEPLIGQYVDLLIKRLHESCGDGTRPVDLAAWYNFTTFDIIGDLAFGEPFGCLENSSYHPWIKMIFEGARVGTWFVSMGHFPLIQKMLIKLVPRKTKERRKARTKMAEAMLMRRMERGEDRPDLIESLLKKKDEWNLSFGKLQANSRILILGGSETTATLLAGTTYLLLTNPHALEKLTEEVRSSFHTEHEININSVTRLKYMLGTTPWSVKTR